MARRTRSTRGRRRTRRARRRTAKKGGGEVHYYRRRENGTVYETDSKGVKLLNALPLGEIAPISTKTVVWVNWDEVEPLGTPEGV